MLQSAAAGCSVSQCVAVLCSVLQCVAVYCCVLQCAAACCRVLQCVGAYCGELQCVADCDQPDTPQTRVRDPGTKDRDRKQDSYCTFQHSQKSAL